VTAAVATTMTAPVTEAEAVTADPAAAGEWADLAAEMGRELQR
jgi:hypothetical protein